MYVLSIEMISNYSGTPLYGHLLNKDTWVLRAVLFLSMESSCIFSKINQLTVSIWPRGFLWFWYVYQAETSSQEIVFIPTIFSPQSQPSKFSLWPRPSGLAELLGLVTNDFQQIRILASEASCLHEFCVIN